MANAQWLKDQVDAAAGWQRLAPVPVQTVCFRHRPEVLSDDEAALEAHNLALAECINQAGHYYLTTSVLKGIRLIRVSVGAQASERAHVEGLWAELRDAAAS